MSEGAQERPTEDHLSRQVLEAGAVRLEVLLEESLDAIVMVEGSGRVLEWSRGAERLFGIPRQKALGANLLDLQAGIPVEAIEAGELTKVDLRHFIAAGPAAWPARVGEARIHRTDGTVRTVQAHVFPVRWAGTSVMGSITRDVTDVRRAEAAQEAMHAIAQAALTATSLGDLGRAIHQVIRTLMPAPNAYIALYDPTTGMVSFPYYVDEQEDYPQPRRGHRGVTEYILRTGQPLLVDRRVIDDLNARGEISAHAGIPESYVGLPLPGPSGVPLGVLAVQSYDPSVLYTEREQALLEFVSSQIALVLQRRQAEEAVRNERDFARSLVDTAQALVLVLDLQGRVIAYNPYTASLTGVPAESAAGQDWFAAFVPEAERDRAQALFRQAVGEGAISGQPFLIRAADGGERLIDWYGARLAGTGGEPTGFLAIGHDITERRRLEEQLLQTHKLETIGRLAGGVAHDFNNVLTAIAGHAQFALDGLPPGDAARVDLSEVLRAADRATALTRQLLAFARRQVIEPRSVNINELVLQTDRMLRRLIGENIELTTSPCPGECVVRADPIQIEQILINLAVNGREAMPDGGLLTVQVSQATLESPAALRLGLDRGDYVRLSVADNGVGMSDEVRTHIFEPFYTTKTDPEGTGLGLATVYAIVKQHGGAIEVSSAPGAGSTFVVYLPRVSATAARLPIRDDERSLPVGSETVLVVEDQQSVRSVAARALRGQGYRVLEASDGAEAIEVARQHPEAIDLLITDIVMPRVSGTELGEALRAERPHLPVLYISGYAEAIIAQYGRQTEDTAILQKPFTIAALVHKTREVLDAGK